MNLSRLELCCDRCSSRFRSPLEFLFPLDEACLLSGLPGLRNKPDQIVNQTLPNIAEKKYCGFGNTAACKYTKTQLDVRKAKRDKCLATLQHSKMIITLQLMFSDLFLFILQLFLCFCLMSEFLQFNFAYAN